jgi:hypothetical protein
MNPEEIKELAEAAGETHWRRVSPLELNEVSLNGSGSMTQVAPGKLEPAGGFFRKRLYAGHRNRNEKPEEVNLGKEIKIVFLRKRRKLVERGGVDGSIVRATNEHNQPKEAVTLYHAETKQSETGIASDLRVKYGGLRTVELIYALLMTDAGEPELVRIPVKGSSLGSEAKAETTTDLYKYMASFDSKEHIWQYYTVLSPVFEQGKMAYFAIDFKRGERIDDETLANVVAPTLRKVRDNCAAVDQSRQEKIAAGITAPAAEPTEVAPEEGHDAAAGGIEYPADEINPDDIPF